MLELRPGDELTLEDMSSKREVTVKVRKIEHLRNRGVAVHLMKYVPAKSVFEV